MLRLQLPASGAGRDSGSVGTWLEFWSSKGACAVSLVELGKELGRRQFF